MVGVAVGVGVSVGVIVGVGVGGSVSVMVGVGDGGSVGVTVGVGDGVGVKVAVGGFVGAIVATFASDDSIVDVRTALACTVGARVIEGTKVGTATLILLSTGAGGAVCTRTAGAIGVAGIIVGDAVADTNIRKGVAAILCALSSDPKRGSNVTMLDNPSLA
jgi:hypothetical protein